MNIYQITVTSHGRTLKIFAITDTIQNALENFKQANKNAYNTITNGEETGTEGEITDITKLNQLFGGTNTTYYM